jgi:Ca2+-binding RTX toxin-like protein
MRLVADGGPGSDALKGGPGDDTFVWNAGGGGDVVEGQAGDDLIAFNGSAAQDALSLAANAKRLRLSRNSGSVTLDAGGVEHVEVRAVGGADGIVVGDLAGTAVVEADIFLAASPLGGGDLQSDELTVTGTALGDSIAVVGETSRPTVLGLAVLVRLFDTEARDTLRVDGAAGPDTIDIASLSPAVLDANVVGGDGNDTINGGPAPDVLSGDAGDDTIDGGADGDVIFGDAGADAADGRPGDDSVLLGPGDDRFVATLGEGSDVVDGGLGTDTEQLDGSGLNEKMSLSASGSALRFVRDVANVVIGANGVEIVTVAAGSSGDTVAVGDLSGTNVSLVAIDNGVSARSTVGDEFADAVTVDGTIAADRLGVSSVGREVRVTGLPWEVRVAHPDAAVDSLAVRGLAGNDAVTVTGSLAALLKLTLDGGFGDDELFGGDGDDKLFGAEGDDSLGGAGGNDELHGGFGTDFLNGGFGADFYSCSGPGDLVFADATDTVSADCQ